MNHSGLDKDTTGLASVPADAHLSVQLDLLARRYRTALLHFFSKRTGNRADAEDLAQEVFIRIARQGDITRVEHIEGYLFQTASNLLRDRARRDATHHVHDHFSIEDSGYEGEAPSEERVYEGRETIERFLSVVAEMPPRRRMVFLMHRFLGLSYGAIALKLGVSVRVVEKHMSKALLQFHLALGPL